MLFDERAVGLEAASGEERAGRLDLYVDGVGSPDHASYDGALDRQESVPGLQPDLPAAVEMSRWQVSM